MIAHERVFMLRERAFMLCERALYVHAWSTSLCTRFSLRVYSGVRTGMCVRSFTLNF